MKYLIYDSELSGHHLEYLHHLYKGAIDRPKDLFIFSVPKSSFEKLKNEFDWPSQANISFKFIDDKELEPIHCGIPLLRFWREAKLCNRISKEVGASTIIVIYLSVTQPFLNWIVNRNTKIRGILYQIYLYTGHHGLRLLVDKFRFFIMSKSNSLERVLVLNDKYGAKMLRQIYRSEKFQFLPDPLLDIKKESLTYVKEKLSIPKNHIVFLHFGAMDYRKGTIEILKAISRLPDDFKGTFIFAGKVRQGIRNEFYDLYKYIVLNKNINVIVHDYFCQYNEIFSLLHSSDCVLMPYHNIGQSSGVLGYASFFNKPVIGPNKGLLGRLIRDNKLGYGLDEINPETLLNSILNFKPYLVSSDYARENSIDNFNSSILD